MADPFDFNNLAQHPAEAPAPPSPTSPHSQARHDDSGHQFRVPGNTTVYQTIGPDAYTSPILAPDGSGTPALNPRSCVTCRRRKVRCDKQMPCSNCRRALIPCIFPAPGRAPRQPRPKDPNALPKNGSKREVELVKRLRKLEGIVEELSGQIETDSTGKDHSSTDSPDAAAGAPRPPQVARRQISSGAEMFSSSKPSPRDTESVSDNSSEAARRRDTSQQFGRLVLSDQKGSKRYVSSAFWTKLNDELDALREETQRLTDHDTDESDYEESPTGTPAVPGGPSADHHAFVLGYRSADVDLRGCHPLPSQVPFLWSVYQENVEPLTKLVHIPSMNEVLRVAMKDTDKLTPGMAALVFAVYFSAVTSLEPDEVQTNFGSSKDVLLSQYRFALEQSLAKANFLHTSDLTVVQAFTLFLIVVRRHDDTRFCWSLTGLVIRIAQGMGLHRDGGHFGLTPFETEMRRRLWWAILILDLRSSEELGTDLTIAEHMYDTQMPTNLNDVDIYPDMTETPEAREGRADSTVLVVRSEICSMSRRLVAASSAMVSMCPQAGEPNIMEREQTLIDLYQRIEHKYLKHVSEETEALYFVAAMISRVIMGKMCLVIYQPLLFSGSEEELPPEIRERIYIAAIEIIEYSHALNTDPRCKKFRWLFMTYTNWHAIAFILIETCRREWTSVVERGWEAVNGFKRDPVECAKSSDHPAVFQPLRKLFLNARKHRAAEIARLRSDPAEVRRLDAEERRRPAQARFGPVPGLENRVGQVREKWRNLVRAEGAAPMVFSNDPSLAGTTYAAEETTSPQPISQATSQPASQGTRGGEAQCGMSVNAAMQYMDELMSQQDTSMTEFWPIQSISAMTPDVPTLSASNYNSIKGELPSDAALRQQALTLQTQLPKEEYLPPYLWSDSFTGMGSKPEDIASGEMDMLGGDFDWQDWSQTLKGMEMETPQPQTGW